MFHNKAFSLVELSIVLVVLGLLTGGILTGQTLIRASELRKLATDFQTYETAVMTFRERFFALPGDMKNATQFWGQSANCPGTHEQGTADGSTCDGNGDGVVSFTGSGSAPTANEHFRFWQHLANAGLLAGQFNGVTSSTSNTYAYCADNKNAPETIDGAVFNIFSIDGSGSRFDYGYGSYSYVVGLPRANAWNQDNFLTPEEVWNIDTKLDDGAAGRGIVLSSVSNACVNTTDGTDFDASYNLQNESKDCRIDFNPSRQ